MDVFGCRLAHGFGRGFAGRIAYRLARVFARRLAYRLTRIVARWLACGFTRVFACRLALGLARRFACRLARRFGRVFAGRFTCGFTWRFAGRFCYDFAGRFACRFARRYILRKGQREHRQRQNDRKHDTDDFFRHKCPPCKIIWVNHQVQSNTNPPKKQVVKFSFAKPLYPVHIYGKNRNSRAVPVMFLSKSVYFKVTIVTPLSPSP